MNTPETPATPLDAVKKLLRSRYPHNPTSNGIAIAAAEETAHDEHALDEIATAWQATRIAQAQAAAALSGAIAAVTHRLSKLEISNRTGAPAEAIHNLTTAR